jgi:hypothetical protein
MQRSDVHTSGAACGIQGKESGHEWTWSTADKPRDVDGFLQFHFNQSEIAGGEW